MGNQLGVVIHQVREDVALGGQEGIDNPADNVLRLCLSEEGARNANPLTKRAAKAAIIAWMGMDTEKLRVNLRSLSAALENIRISELVAARANLEGIPQANLLQRIALQEGIANFEQASAQDKARISRIAALDGRNPEILQAMPNNLNIQALRLISQIAEQLSSTDILRDKLREQIRSAGNEDLAPRALDLEVLIGINIDRDTLGRNARDQIVQLQDRLDEQGIEALEPRRQLNEELAEFRRDVDVHVPRLTALNAETKALLSQSLFLMRKADGRDRQIEEVQAVRLQIANAREINEARENNDEGNLLHKALIRERVNQLRIEEKHSFHALLVNGEAGNELLKQQSKMVVAGIIVDGRRVVIPRYMEHIREQLGDLQDEFRELNLDEKNQVLSNLYAEDGQMPDRPNARAIWRQLRTLAYGLLIGNHGFRESVKAGILNHEHWFIQQLRERVEGFSDLVQLDQKSIYTYIFSNQTISEDLPQIVQGLARTLRLMRAEAANPAFDASRNGRNLLEVRLCRESEAFTGLNGLSKDLVINYVLAPTGGGIDQRISDIRNVLQICRESIAAQA